MSEGGIGWVAMLHDRLENIVDRSGYGHYFPGDLRPAEVLRRNFWFATIDDPSTLCTRDTIGIDNITFESDYPHGDGTWPDTQAVFARRVRRISPPTRSRKISHENAAALFRHPLPPPGSPHAVGVRTMTEMPATTRRCCATRIEGERFGDAFFGDDGRSRQPDADRREKLRTLQTVEARTATTLRTALSRDVGLHDRHGDESRRRARARARASTPRAGTNFAKGLRDALPHVPRRSSCAAATSSRRPDAPRTARARRPRAGDRTFAELEAAGDEEVAAAAQRSPARPRA